MKGKGNRPGGNNKLISKGFDNKTKRTILEILNVKKIQKYLRYLIIRINK